MRDMRVDEELDGEGGWEDVNGDVGGRGRERRSYYAIAPPVSRMRSQSQGQARRIRFRRITHAYANAYDTEMSGEGEQ